LYFELPPLQFLVGAAVLFISPHFIPEINNFCAKTGDESESKRSFAQSV
jgi:hypothetical protein